MSDEAIHAFIDDYWKWKRREITEEPKAEDYALNPMVAEMYARQVHHAFEQMMFNRTVKRQNENEGTTGTSQAPPLTGLGREDSSSRTPHEESKAESHGDA